VLVTEDLYDKEFVESCTVGFEEWSAELQEFTPEWAAEITGIDAETIRTLGKDLGAAGHFGVIEQGWRGAFGCAYQNSFETARCITAVNALLGNYNQKGGAMLYPSTKLGSLDPVKFPKVPEVTAKKAGAKEYPLQSSSQGIVNVVAAKAKEGSMKAAFFYNSNAAKAYGNPKDWKEGLEAMELKVCIDVQMSETAMLCDYVLAECSYLERNELPQTQNGKQPAIEGRFKAIELVHPETLPCDEIFVGLAKASGIGQYFGFTCEELTKAQVESVGLTVEDLAEKGILTFGEAWAGLDKPPTFATGSTKYEFVSQKVAKVEGLKLEKPVITWIPPKVMPGEGEFRLIGGKQAIHSHTMTTSSEALMNITKEYNMQRIWISASKAKDLGIKEGDLVEVSNDLYTGQVEAHVTERINPSCVWMPTHYGGSSPYLTQGYEVGIPHMEYVPFEFQPDVGTPMTQETTVTIKKVSA
jgi:thiosulfate reductase/polysulfide reductase chain A